VSRKGKHCAEVLIPLCQFRTARQSFGKPGKVAVYLGILGFFQRALLTRRSS
jgi:hypothetical protein